MASVTPLGSQLIKAGPRATAMACSFFICKGRDPVDLAEAEQHLTDENCPSCKREFEKFERSQRVGQYLNKTGWWDPYRKDPINPDYS
jgi:hypothetical protein